MSTARINPVVASAAASSSSMADATNRPLTPTQQQPHRASAKSKGKARMMRYEERSPSGFGAEQ